MAEGKTLWEMLVGAVQGPAERGVYNPLKAKIGSSFLINEIDWKDLNFFVKEIREYRRRIEAREFLFVDYVLLARPLNGADVWVRIRLNPVNNPDPAGGLTHDVLLLRLYDEMAYDEGFHNVVNDTTRKLEVSQPGQPAEEYTRINDVTASYKAQVKILKSADRDDTEKTQIEYWDYWREVPDEAGQPRRQYLFVEMDKNTGWFQLWQGQDMDPQRILVM